MIIELIDNGAREDFEAWWSSFPNPGPLNRHKDSYTYATTRAAWAAWQASLCSHSENGYQQAFYELSKMLEISAQSLSPSEVWEKQMLPALKSAVSSASKKPIDLMQFREAVLTWAEVAENDFTDERYDEAMRLLKIIDGQDGEEK